MSKIEYSQPFGVTEEANIMKINFSNAIEAFAGMSATVTKKMEQDGFKEFLELKSRWKDETRYFSSGSGIFSNSAYVGIISKGPVAIPWIIRELIRENDYWYNALEQITGINPIKSENIGLVENMKEDWLQWAQDNNYEQI